jgi:AcrR family transcriptional regulator
MAHIVDPIQNRAVRTKQEIEGAAITVLKTIGRDAFTTSDVAKQAGVSIGTLYRYFEDRIAILDAVWPERKDITFDE